jgi:hypothetical protein
MIFCTTCGRPRNGPVRYCTTCGAPFPDGPSMQAAPADRPTGPKHRAGTAAAGRPDMVAVYRQPVGSAVGSVAGGDPFGRLLATRGRGRAGLAERFEPTVADRRARDGEPPYLAPDLPADLQPGPVPRRRRKAAVAVLAAAVLLVAAAGGVDLWLMHRHHATSAASPGLTKPRGSVSRGGGGSSGAAAPGTQPGSRKPSAAPKHRPAPGPAISSRIVTVAPGIGRNPHAAQVKAYLGRYFTAINNHNYQQFQPLLGTDMRKDEPATRFYPGYQSTTDSAAVLTSISDIGPGLITAAVTFTSHQLPADTPSGTACTNWSITLYLSQHGRRYLLEPPPPGYHAVYQPC